MDAELYLDLNTVIHRLDARTKITLFIYTFIGLILFENPLWLLPLCSLILLHGIVSRSLKNLRRIRYILIVLTISSLIMWNIFASGDTPLFWFLDAESAIFSVGRTMLMLFMITGGMILISTTRNEELVLGMIKMGLPYRVGFAISTSLRLVPTIASSLITVTQAQRSRGLDLESGNILARIKKFIPLLIPVFISTIRSTNIFGMALESKGFGARDDRTFYLQMKMGALDYVLLIFGLIFTLTMIFLNLQGYGDIPGLIRF
ncbi:MAG TPA: energy-coupling factor transporter transmembrane protein EcfT [Chloroflexi bacterium]|nr:MAG: cobalt ABC transporter permease [Anaerolineaceae bacterium 4572_5.2]HEY83956.1 energy-coupling factor transporter transmembrane protein EcfT [Chloroflexota bacterium]